jgi:hypothetical protein
MDKYSNISCLLNGDRNCDLDIKYFDSRNSDGSFITEILNLKLDYIRKNIYKNIDFHILVAVSSLYGFYTNEDVIIKTKNEIVKIVKKFLSDNNENYEQGLIRSLQYILSKNISKFNDEENELLISDFITFKDNFFIEEIYMLLDLNFGIKIPVENKINTYYLNLKNRDGDSFFK